MGVSGFSCQWLIPVVVTLIAACSNEPSVTAGSADKVFQNGKIYAFLPTLMNFPSLTAAASAQGCFSLTV